LSICGSESEDVLAVVVVVPRGGAQVARPLSLLHQLTFEHVGGGEGEGGVLPGEEVDLHGCCCYSLPGPMLLVCNQCTVSIICVLTYQLAEAIKKYK
jgi:hypothetical protein